MEKGDDSIDFMLFVLCGRSIVFYKVISITKLTNKIYLVVGRTSLVVIDVVEVQLIVLNRKDTRGFVTAPIALRCKGDKSYMSGLSPATSTFKTGTAWRQI